MQKKSNKNDHGISLMITLTSIPAWWWIFFIRFLTPGEIVPKFVNYLVLWFPAICQMVSCFLQYDLYDRIQINEKRESGVSY